MHANKLHSANLSARLVSHHPHICDADCGCIVLLPGFAFCHPQAQEYPSQFLTALGKRGFTVGCPRQGK